MCNDRRQSPQLPPPKKFSAECTMRSVRNRSVSCTEGTVHLLWREQSGGVQCAKCALCSVQRASCVQAAAPQIMQFLIISSADNIGSLFIIRHQTQAASAPLMHADGTHTAFRVASSKSIHGITGVGPLYDARTAAPPSISVPAKPNIASKTSNHDIAQQQNKT